MPVENYSIGPPRPSSKEPRQPSKAREQLHPSNDEQGLNHTMPQLLRDIPVGKAVMSGTWPLPDNRRGSDAEMMMSSKSFEVDILNVVKKASANQRILQLVQTQRAKRQQRQNLRIHQKRLRTKTMLMMKLGGGLAAQREDDEESAPPEMPENADNTQSLGGQQYVRRRSCTGERMDDRQGDDWPTHYSVGARGFCIDFLLRVQSRGSVSAGYQVMRLLGAARRIGTESAVIIEAVDRERFTTELLADVTDVESCENAKPKEILLKHAHYIMEHKKKALKIRHLLNQWLMRENVMESIRHRGELLDAEESLRQSKQENAKLAEFWPQFRDGSRKVVQRGQLGPTKAASRRETVQSIVHAPMPKMDTDMRGMNWKTRPMRSEGALPGWKISQQPESYTPRWRESGTMDPRRESGDSPRKRGPLARQRPVRQNDGALGRVGPALLEGGGCVAGREHVASRLPASRRGEQRPRSQGTMVASDSTCGPEGEGQVMEWRVRTTESFRAQSSREGLSWRPRGGRRSELARPQKESHRWWQNGPFYVNAGMPGIPPRPSDAVLRQRASKQLGQSHSLPDLHGPRASSTAQRHSREAVGPSSPGSSGVSPIHALGEEEGLVPLALEAFEDPWSVGEAKSVSLILADKDPPTKKYLRTCQRKGVMPIPLPFVTGSSNRFEAKAGALNDQDLSAIASMVPDSKVDEINLQGNPGLSAAALQEFLEALFQGAASLTLKQIDLRRCVKFGQVGPMSTMVRLLEDLAVERLQVLHLSGVPLSVRMQLPLCRAIRQHDSLHTVSLADTGLGAGHQSSVGDLGEQCIRELLGCITLRSLDLSWNCFSVEVFSHMGQQLVETQLLRSLNLAGCSSHSPDCPGEEISPVVFFIERLSHVYSLTSLDVSLNRLDHRGALVLEDALCQAKSLLELYVTHNPLGALGIRCLARLLSRSTSGLRRFDCEDCSNGQPSEQNSTMLFDAVNPGGHYKLDLSKPYHRSLLRMLYKTSALFQVDPADSFRELQAQPKFDHPQKDASGVLQLPSHGRLSLTFTIEKATEKVLQGFIDKPFSAFLDKHKELTHASLVDHKVVPLLALWRRLLGRSEERTVILEAMSKDFNFSPAHLELFCNQPGSNTAEIAYMLLPCVTGGRAGMYLSQMLPTGIPDYSNALAYLRNWLLFNPDNPTGRYRLELSQPADRAVAERLAVLDCWEASLGRLSKRQDTSQFGNRSNVRNAMYNNIMLGNLLDGTRPIWEWSMPGRGTLLLDYTSARRPPKCAEVLEDAAFDSLLATLQQKDPAPPEHRLQALRNTSHLFHVLSLQLREILDSFQDESLRAETFIILFNRVADMYNEKVFRVRFENEVDGLRSRLGHATYFPFIQPEQSFFELDLSFHDQRLAAQSIIILHFRERVSNIVDPRYVVDGVLRHDDFVNGVPRLWESFDRMPKIGVFSCSYKCAGAHRNFKVRREFMESYGGWHVDVEPSSVMWWLSLTEAPRAVLDFIEYLNVHFHDIQEPVKRMDCLAHDGALSFSEFSQGLERIGYQKFKGLREKEREEHVNAIFGFLDIGEQRELQVTDTVKLLEGAYKEVKLNIREFVQFCERLVGPELDDFWTMLVRGQLEKSIEKAQFQEVVRSMGYFGPAEAVFLYLSFFEEGGLTREMFRQRLQDFKNRGARSVVNSPMVTRTNSMASQSMLLSPAHETVKEGDPEKGVFVTLSKLADGDSTSDGEGRDGSQPQPLALIRERQKMKN